MSDHINLGKTSLYLTPSNEQLIQIAKENPEFHAEIKESIFKEMKESAIKTTRHRIESYKNTLYDKLYTEVEKRTFEASNYWKDKSAKFSDSLNKELTSEIEIKLNEIFITEMKEYLESREFQIGLKNKIREKIMTTVLQSLDDQIQEEAKKLIS